MEIDVVISFFVKEKIIQVWIDFSPRGLYAVYNVLSCYELEATAPAATPAGSRNKLTRLLMYLGGFGIDGARQIQPHNQNSTDHCSPNLDIHARGERRQSSD
jgi:hypothetical protein